MPVACRTVAPADVPDTPWNALHQLLREQAARPLLTYYDDASGERVELSVASVENAVAKTANLLVDGLALDPGAVVAVHLPLHWQHAVWQGAVWAAGMVLAPYGDPATADLLVVGPDDLALAAGAAEAVAVSLDPMGMPFRDPLQPGVLDHAVEARMHGDRFAPPPVPADAPVLVSGPDASAHSWRQLVGHAEDLGGRLGLPPGGRLMTSADPDTLDGTVAMLALPLTVGGSAVLVRHEDVGRRTDRLAVERVDAVLT